VGDGVAAGINEPVTGYRDTDSITRVAEVVVEQPEKHRFGGRAA